MSKPPDYEEKVEALRKALQAFGERFDSQACHLRIEALLDVPVCRECGQMGERSADCQCWNDE